MPTINLYTWHKSKESVFLQVQQEKNWIFRAIAPRISGKKIWRSDQLIWFGTGLLKFSHSLCLWIKQYGSFSWSNVEVSNRNSTFSFPHKKRASKILPHDGVFGWPQFQKKPWDCDTTLMLSFVVIFLPTNFHRCDLPPCTPALGKDPPAMPGRSGKKANHRKVLLHPASFYKWFQEMAFAPWQAMTAITLKPYCSLCFPIMVPTNP